MRRPICSSTRRRSFTWARLAVSTLVAMAALGLASPTPAAPRPGPRFGLFSTGSTTDTEEVAAGLREGFRLSGLEPDLLERNVDGDEASARSALNEFALERVDIVFVLGPDAALLARDTLSEPSVVFAAVGYPEVLGLPGRGNVCGVAGGVDAGSILEWARRNAPSLRTIGVVAAGDTESRTLGLALEAAARERGIELTRAGHATAASLASGCEAIWLPPGVTDKEAEQIARALKGKGVPLLGSRRGHLRAGCSAVLFTSPRTHGLLAAALGRRVLRGEAPQTIGVSRPRRRLSQVSLHAAQRLGIEVPMAVVATADHLVPAIGRRR